MLNKTCQILLTNNNLNMIIASKDKELVETKMIELSEKMLCESKSGKQVMNYCPNCGAEVILDEN